MPGCVYHFEDWAEAHYGDDEPPYDSCEGENYDEDEHVLIDIVDIAQAIAWEKQALARRNEALDRARSAAPPPKTKKTDQAKFGEVRFEYINNFEMFVRQPCRIEGGVLADFPNEYGHGTEKNSHAYMLQRISDRNYAMRSMCMDQGGAVYANFSKRNTMCKLVTWYPNSNLDDHSNDETIVDACHLDLVNKEDGGSTFCTPENLKKAVHPGTTCIFMNNYQRSPCKPQSLLDSIQTCAGSLQCIALSETYISNNILQAVASCPNLLGITLDMLMMNTGGSSHSTATDEGLAAVLRSCPKLKWLFVQNDKIFGTACWTALAGGACPSLEVLWVRATLFDDNFFDKAVGDVSVIRSVLASRDPSLKLCMVNPDKDGKSRYIAGNKTDRLGGERIDKVYDDEEEDCGDDMDDI